MRTLTVLIIAFVAVLAGCSPEERNSIPQTDFAGLEPLLHKQNDTVYLINFWATWCKPCIEELPAFERINEEFEDRAVKVVLVSLDFPNRYAEQLVPFVEKENIRSKVVHLTEVNANSWIDKVDRGWSGAIPATLIYQGEQRGFYEQKLSYPELKKIVEQKLKI
jgi:thiol-disulfide isomerase/thioredoxin